MDRLKAAGEYEAFKTKKSKEGMRCYHTMSEEQPNEVKHKNLILQKAWMQRMKDEGTYEAYCYLFYCHLFIFIFEFQRNVNIYIY